MIKDSFTAMLSQMVRNGVVGVLSNLLGYLIYRLAVPFELSRTQAISIPTVRRDDQGAY